MEYKGQDPNDKGEISPFSQYCLTSLPPLYNFSIKAEREAAGCVPEDSKTQFNGCRCKKSKCLKLYCECFAASKYCEGCGCQDCMNHPQFEEVRNEAISQTLERNPGAFRQFTAFKRGCNCRKSGCLKKYCECFNSGRQCASLCKCHGCQNTSNFYLS